MESNRLDDLRDLLDCSSSRDPGLLCVSYKDLLTELSTKCGKAGSESIIQERPLRKDLVDVLRRVWSWSRRQDISPAKLVEEASEDSSSSTRPGLELCRLIDDQGRPVWKLLLMLEPEQALGVY